MTVSWSLEPDCGGTTSFVCEEVIEGCVEGMDRDSRICSTSKKRSQWTDYLLLQVAVIDMEWKGTGETLLGCLSSSTLRVSHIVENKCALLKINVRRWKQMQAIEFKWELSKPSENYQNRVRTIKNEYLASEANANHWSKTAHTCTQKLQVMKALQFRNAMARTTAMWPFARAHIEGLINGGGVHKDDDLDGSSWTCSKYLSKAWIARPW